MNDSKIPVRYAKALLQLSEEKELTERVYRDIIRIQELVKLPDVKDILQSPVIPSDKKNKILKSILPKNIQELTISFINMVFQNKRETYFEDISRNFIRTYKSLRNIKTLVITTAIKVNDEVKESFKKQVSKTYKANIEMETIIDPDIIGGFIVQVNDVLYDASVKRQLKNMQQSLIKRKL